MKTSNKQSFQKKKFQIIILHVRVQMDIPIIIIRFFMKDLTSERLLEFPRVILIHILPMQCNKSISFFGSPCGNIIKIT
jgi:hypothetical protein